MEQGKAVGIWIRVSTEDQVNGESPEHHEKRARLYAEARGWDVKVVYQLDALSGKSVMGYPETKRMLEDIRSGLITGLVFSKVARLARNAKELLEFADIFKEENADLISLQEAIDTSTPSGRLFYTMIAALAQWEREEIADRVAASIPIRAKLGKSLGGHPSLGYKWEGKDFIIDEKFAPVRTLIYDLFLEHKRKKTVARVLNEKGYRTQNGHKFTDTTIVRLLRDPTAKGHRRANYTKRVSDGKHWELKPTSEWIILPCPALVSEGIWNECNRLLDDSEKERKNIGPKPKHLLAGFVHCESCNGKMYVFHHTNCPTYTCKKCKVRIPVSDLEEIFYEQLKTFLLTDTTISEYLEKVDLTLKERQRLLDHVLEERGTIQKEMKGMIAMRANNELSKEFFVEHYKPLEERITQINDQLPELEAEIDFLRIQNQSTDVVLQDAKDLYSQWNILSYEDKRNIIELITDRITIGKEDIHIKLSYLPAHLPKQTESQKQTKNQQHQINEEQGNATRWQ